MITTVFAIDPGSKSSGIAEVRANLTIGERGNYSNLHILTILDRSKADHLVIERPTTLRRPRIEIDAAIFWAGRFTQEWVRQHDNREDSASTILRGDVLRHICPGKRGDPAVRKALVELFGEPGKKNAPGELYKITEDALQAVAIGWVYLDKQAEKTEQGET